jgi:hypothetical protein
VGNKRQDSDRWIAEVEEKKTNEPLVAGKCLCCRTKIYFDDTPMEPNHDLIGAAGIAEISCGYGSQHDQHNGERHFGLLCDRCHTDCIADGRIKVESFDERTDLTPVERNRSLRWQQASQTHNWSALQQIQQEEDD